MKRSYHRRVWLNPPKSSSTGSVVAFDGMAQWSMGANDNRAHAMFLEISDCHGKVRIHASRFESRRAFSKKIRKLAKVIAKFAEHLESACVEKEEDL